MQFSPSQLPRAGKSAFLKALLGELAPAFGQPGAHPGCGGRFAFADQSAWIVSGTVRDNVLFGRRMDPERYWAALRAAALLPDLEVFPNGDLTELGEKGIVVSTGAHCALCPFTRSVVVCYVLVTVLCVGVSSPCSAADHHHQ